MMPLRVHTAAATTVYARPLVAALIRAGLLRFRDFALGRMALRGLVIYER
jgi:hypothetical protein